MLGCHLNFAPKNMNHFNISCLTHRNGCKTSEMAQQCHKRHVEFRDEDPGYVRNEGDFKMRGCKPLLRYDTRNCCNTARGQKKFDLLESVCLTQGVRFIFQGGMNNERSTDNTCSILSIETATSSNSTVHIGQQISERDIFSRKRAEPAADLTLRRNRGRFNFVEDQRLRTRCCLCLICAVHPGNGQ